MPLELKERRAREVARAKEPSDQKLARLAVARDLDAAPVKGVSGAAALAQRDAVEAFAVVGLQRQGVAAFALRVELLLMTRRAAPG
ncbi:MAG: hypothetical protein K2X03_30165 [Bryobacteraceae bacterium]|nr:hypothetical protein [Bryobacteraceae bacterium]